MRQYPLHLPRILFISIEPPFKSAMLLLKNEYGFILPLQRQLKGVGAESVFSTIAHFNLTKLDCE